ncbi:MAG: hypothetical protein ACP5KZ_04940 [bacterium]
MNFFEELLTIYEGESDGQVQLQSLRTLSESYCSFTGHLIKVIDAKGNATTE